MLVVVPHPAHEVVVRLFGRPNPTHRWAFSPGFFRRRGYSVRLATYRVSLFRGVRVPYLI